MSERLRGQEVTLQVVVDGDVKTGSFAKVTDFEWSPRQDITEVPFLGEVEDDLDLQHHGFDFSFSLQQQDRKVHDLLILQVAREKARTRQPVINLVVTYAYRAGLDAAQTLVFENVKMKLDSSGAPGRKEYVGAKFSGKCKTVSSI